MATGNQLRNRISTKFSDLFAVLFTFNGNWNFVITLLLIYLNFQQFDDVIAERYYNEYYENMRKEKTSIPNNEKFTCKLYLVKIVKLVTTNATTNPTN